MLMFTHTWILKEFLGTDSLERHNLDILTYNVSPDILCVNRRISPDLTHGITRFRELPPQYTKAAFVYFHLLTDDIAHHGEIGMRPISEFNPNSKGYTYVKGKSLILPLMAFYESLGEEISYSNAAYRAHIIIEMAFDQVLYKDQENQYLLPMLYESINHTVKSRMQSFGLTLEWLYGVERTVIENTMQRALAACTMERMKNFMSVEGRISLYCDKFGLDGNNDLAGAKIRELIFQGMDLVNDYKDFLQPTITALKNSGIVDPLSIALS